MEGRFSLTSCFFIAVIEIDIGSFQVSVLVFDII